MLQWSSKIGVAVIKQFNRGLCDPSAQLHEVGNHREYGLLGFFTALPFQTSLVNKQSGRWHVGGNLKFSTRASGAVEKSGVHRDNPPGCGLKKEMFFQWLQPWGLLLSLLRSFLIIWRCFRCSLRPHSRFRAGRATVCCHIQDSGADLLWIFYVIWTQIQRNFSETWARNIFSAWPKEDELELPSKMLSPWFRGNHAFHL